MEHPLEISRNIGFNGSIIYKWRMFKQIKVNQRWQLIIIDHRTKWRIFQQTMLQCLSTRMYQRKIEGMDFEVEVAREIETEGDIFEEEHWDFNSQKGHETNCLMER